MFTKRIQWNQFLELRVASHQPNQVPEIRRLTEPWPDMESLPHVPIWPPHFNSPLKRNLLMSLTVGTFHFPLLFQAPFLSSSAQFYKQFCWPRNSSGILWASTTIALLQLTRSTGLPSTRCDDRTWNRSCSPCGEELRGQRESEDSEDSAPSVRWCLAILVCRQYHASRGQFLPKPLAVVRSWHDPANLSSIEKSPLAHLLRSLCLKDRGSHFKIICDFLNLIYPGCSAKR